MSDKFLKCLAFTLKWEGKISDNSADPGGLTNQGITQRTYDNYRKQKGEITRSVVEMTNDERNDIYEHQYWISSGCEDLDIKLAACQFDTCVNMGQGKAAKFLFLSANNPETYIGLREARYKELVVANPKFEVFLKGWLNRTKSLREFVKKV